MILFQSATRGVERCPSNGYHKSIISRLAIREFSVRVILSAAHWWREMFDDRLLGSDLYRIFGKLIIPASECFGFDSLDLKSMNTGT